ncbi:adenosylcobinamide-phosphate synthase CbiB [Epibacterium ulvae]|uniref:adenosylcobinamide-phosphate synthase CbiB n=1 Tax=Epibacterium ulvae TaxID=1156985 RepID=UPI002491F1A0|nr:adenosylcobinamide-phosphate synthase CbiB [Epibacterium ulvae]
MITAILLVPALILDAVLGEPKWLWSHIPHPAVLMGRLIDALDTRLNQGPHQRLKGVATVVTLLFLGLFIGFALQTLGAVVTVLTAAILLAQRSLCDHVRAVAEGLQKDLASGRYAVSMIVSRDTADMTTAQVARSAIESGAENLSDGVIAPAFWFLVAGLPGLITYKIINTADSMIGYRTPRHEAFGWAAARLDDVLNWVPARLTSACITLVTLQPKEWSNICRDARKHRSPNAGWPEAAMARLLSVSLAGPRSYDGEMRSFPWVHEAGRKDLTAQDIHHCVMALWKIWGCFLVLTVALALLF